MSEGQFSFTGKILRVHPGSQILVAHFTDVNSSKIGDTHAIIPEEVLENSPSVQIGDEISGVFEVVDGQSQVVRIDDMSP